MSGNLCHFFRHFWRCWLFKPKRFIGCQALRHTNSARRGKLTMRTKKQVCLVADGLSYFPTKGFAALKVHKCRLMRIMGDRGIDLRLIDIWEKDGEWEFAEDT